MKMESGCTYEEWQKVEIYYNEYGRFTYYHIKEVEVDYDGEMDCGQDGYEIDNGHNDEDDSYRSYIRRLINWDQDNYDGNHFDSAKVEQFYGVYKDYGLKDHYNDDYKLNEYLNYFDDHMEFCGSWGVEKFDDEQECHNKDELKDYMQNKYNGKYSEISYDFDIKLMEDNYMEIEHRYTMKMESGCTYEEWQKIDMYYNEYGKITSYHIKEDEVDYETEIGCGQNEYETDNKRGNGYVALLRESRSMWQNEQNKHGDNDYDEDKRDKSDKIDNEHNDEWGSHR
jgi:flagellar biosynthesis chaperone FliJ